MDSNSSSEITLDSIDVTIFEDFYGLDITLPFSTDSVAAPTEVRSSSSMELEKEPEKASSEVLPSPKKVRVSEIAPDIVPVEVAEQEQEPVPVLESEMEQTISMFTNDLTKFELTKIPTELICLSSESEKVTDQTFSEFCSAPANQVEKEKSSEMLLLDSESDEDLEVTICMAESEPEIIEAPLEVIPSVSVLEKDPEQTCCLLSTSLEEHLLTDIPSEIFSSLPTNTEPVSELEQTISVFTSDANNSESKLPPVPEQEKNLEQTIDEFTNDFNEFKLPSVPGQDLEQTISVFTSDANNSEFKLPSVPEQEKDLEQTFSVFSSNLNNLRLNKTPSRFRQPLIIFSPAVVPQQSKCVINDSVFSPLIESSENKDPHIEVCTPKRPETPTDMDKTLVLRQISARTNQSPLYTPVSSIVSRFRNLALESPYPLSDINNKPKQETPKIVKEPSPLKKSGQHQRLEKVKLISPLLRSPKFRPLSTRLPSRSNSKVCNSSVKKSPTIAQYKANPPVNQGSRIPVLKLL